MNRDCESLNPGGGATEALSRQTRSIGTVSLPNIPWRHRGRDHERIRVVLVLPVLTRRTESRVVGGGCWAVAVRTLRRPVLCSAVLRESSPPS